MTPSPTVHDTPPPLASTEFDAGPTQQTLLEQEVADLKRKIAAMSSLSSNEESVPPTTSPMAETPGPFHAMQYTSFNDSGDPRVWLRDFQKAAENNCANDRTSFCCARAAMTSAADTWFNRTTWLRQDWNEFLAKFEQRFVSEEAIRDRAGNILKSLQHAPPLKFTEHTENFLALCKDITLPTTSIPGR